MSKLKVFISYDKIDRKYVYELSIHLTGLMRNGLIEVWNDLGVLPGSVWDTEINAMLERADIIIFLISPDFMASDYLNDVEINKAIERSYQGEACIVPIIIRPCDFQSSPINEFQVLPKNAKPISTWVDKDEAWLDVLNGIKKIISGFDKKQRSQSPNTAKNGESINSPDGYADNLKTEIEKGNIEQAIKDLLTITKEKNNDVYNSLVMLSSRFNSYNRNWSDGLISDELANITKNQIKKTLVSIINVNFLNEYAN